MGVRGLAPWRTTIIESIELMTLQEFVTNLKLGKMAYIVIIPTNSWEYNLEVEISLGVIGGVYPTSIRTDARGLRKVTKLADQLRNLLIAKGVRVLKNRHEWIMDDLEELMKPIGSIILQSPH